MQKNPAKDCFGLCTGANKPGLAIMLHGYCESLSGSSAKGSFGWKSSLYKLNIRVPCVHMAGSAQPCYEKPCK